MMNPRFVHGDKPGFKKNHPCLDDTDLKTPQTTAYGAFGSATADKLLDKQQVPEEATPCNNTHDPGIFGGIQDPVDGPYGVR